MIDRPLPSLIDLTSLAGGAVDGHVIAALEAAGFAGLRTKHGYVVQRLIAGDGTVTAIARSLSVTQQAVSKTVAELERLGYVGRTVDRADARRKSLVLTERGMAAIATARDARAALLTRVAAKIGSARVTDAEEAMRAILGALGLSDRVEERTVPDPSST